MWIENRNPTGLIPAFDRVELPALAVIIGINGSGKSQLLRGIKEGWITSLLNDDGTAGPMHPPADTVLLTNFDPVPSGITTPLNSNAQDVLARHVSATDAAMVVQEVLERQQNERDAIRTIIAGNGAPVPSDGAASWSTLVNSVEPHHMPTSLVPAVSRETLMAAGMRLQTFIQQHTLHGRQIAMVLPAIPTHLLYWSRRQFASMVGWQESSLFEPSLVSIFKEYRDRRWRNVHYRALDDEEGTNNAISKDEFRDKFGIPPWDRVTAALKTFGLPYEVMPIETNLIHDVRFRLRRPGTTQALDFDALSSGEKVLLRMVLAGFLVNDDRINVQPPQVILLDELDASLHPENVQRWMTAVQSGFVEGLGASCILTTHSPTTVALADENSIFEMTPDDAVPRPINKQRAVDRLTANLPMLSINYSARRQVFAESNIDVDHYARLHDLMRPRIELPRTLTFVGTGTKGSCSFVYEMVRQMAEHGNRAVFGIVDWDLKNKPTNRVRVLAESTHYAKENVLLDPLLIGALLIKNDELALEPPVSFVDLASGNAALLQRVSDAVVAKVAWPAAAGQDVSVNHYWGGARLTVRTIYQQRQGHDLEAALKAAFPMLQRYRAEGELATEVIRRVLGELPDLCPQPIVDLLRALAGDEPNGDVG